MASKDVKGAEASFKTGPHDRLNSDRGLKKDKRKKRRPKRKRIQDFNSAREKDFNAGVSKRADEFSDKANSSKSKAASNVTNRKPSNVKAHAKGKGKVSKFTYDITTTSVNAKRAVADAQAVSSDERDISEQVTDSASRVAGRALVPGDGYKKSEEKWVSVESAKSGGKLKFSKEEKFSEKEIPGLERGKRRNPGSGDIRPSRKNPYREQTIRGGKKSNVSVKDETAKSRAKTIQKNRIKKNYATALNNAKRGKQVEGAAGAAVRNVAGKAKQIAVRIARNNAPVFAILVFAGVFIIGAMSLFSTVGSVLSESGGSFVSTTYLSSDDDIKAVNDDYEELERQLQAQIDNIESSYPGYDEYRYQVDEISHDPYALTSYLTVLYQNYKEADVRSAIEELFRKQFDLNLQESTEIRIREVVNEDGTTTTEEYEVKILTVVLKNLGIEAVAVDDLESEQYGLYATYQSTLGNRSYLFGDVLTAGGGGSGGGMNYEIPPEALSDECFANMVNEAENYLGMEYVWGGYSPTSGFDCSGFVSYVINNCGNGWNIGRQTANGLRSLCTYVPVSEAKPGDLIFFEKTYNTAGASHVGIYAGDGMMLHCGNPIQFTSINSNYWKSHFLAFGRL